MHYIHAWVSPMWIPKKVRQDTSRQTSIFASDWICGSCSAFQCVEAWNIDAPFFMIGCVQYGFDKMRTGTRYSKLVFFHLMDLRVT
jgi:hypothetical protein